MNMECCICARPFSKTRRATCPSCAQARLYRPRIQQATALLNRENAHTRAEAIVRPGNDGVLAALPSDADWDAITDGVKKHGGQRAAAEQARVESRVEDVVQQSDILKRQIEEHRVFIEERKHENQKRRILLAKEREALEQRRSQVLNPLKIIINKASHRIERVHIKTVDARAFICKETSLLSGLYELKDARGRSSGRYVLDGLTLPNLKELHAPVQDLERPDLLGTPPALHLEYHESINASLDNICRVVRLWCHYLSIRLPAEIVLPHNSFPHSAILSERSSYRFSELPYPGVLANQPHSPATSRLLSDPRVFPRPRLLNIDRSLARLMKEDSKTFGLFLEGVMLLAWDVAWLCRTQGITSINTFDEVCDIGKNLWLLSRMQEASSGGRPSMNRINTGATDATTRSKGSTDTVRFGSYSHGSLRHSLASHEGATMLQDWHLAQPHRLVDKLRHYILTEITGEEWDVLSEGDYDDERQDEVAVLVGGANRRSLESNHPAMSVMSVAPHEQETAIRPKAGETGWMKVRGRNADG